MLQNRLTVFPRREGIRLAQLPHVVPIGCNQRQHGRMADDRNYGRTMTCLFASNHFDGTSVVVMGGT